jgi:predicted dehydrogenase
MFATAAAAAAAWHANPSNRLFAADTPPTGPNDTLSVAIVGGGGRGGHHIEQFLRRKDCEITWLVDVDEKVANGRADQVAKRQGKRPQIAADLRKALEDKSLDIVSIATPNHWHALGAIWALQAGKDVYVEKPVSHNVSEGRRIVEAARKYNKICQTGTQSRSMKGMRDGIQFVHDGGIGEVKLARGLCYKRRPSIGPKGDYEPPKTVNYDLWLGPAPMAPVTRQKFHYDWHWQFPYGNGDLGNQGIHQVDIARWGLKVDQLANRIFSFGGRIGYEDAGDTPNTDVCSFRFDSGKELVFEVRGLETKPFMGAAVGNIFHGSEGYAMMPSYMDCIAFDTKGNKVKEFHGAGDHLHFDNFISAVRSRKVEDLHADILEGHLSSALCHLGNISYRLADKQVPVAELSSLANQENAATFSHDLIDRLQQHVADNKLDPNATKLSVGPSLNFDPKTEKFIGRADADAMLTREYRAPFVVPQNV